jgi:hypothetical protein
MWLVRLVCIDVLELRKDFAGLFNDNETFAIVLYIYSSVTMNGSDNMNNFIVRLRGLPWNTNQSEVQSFLQGKIWNICFFCEKNQWILGCKIRQTQFLTNDQGRSTGECFVVVETKEDIDMAKSFDKKKMGNRK